jgi:hypothetical protein
MYLDSCEPFLPHLEDNMLFELNRRMFSMICAVALLQLSACATKQLSEATLNTPYDESTKTVQVKVCLDDHNSEQASLAATEVVRPICPTSNIVILSAEDRVYVDNALFARGPSSSRKYRAIRPQKYRYYNMACRE